MISLEISITDQILRVIDDGREIHRYPISSAKNGIGFEEGSFKTPTGRFIIAEKHGHDAPLNTIFKGRQPVGIWDACNQCDGDFVTTRILWLDGIEADNANTKQRYIYIHGTNHENHIGTPHSCGCIRMLNLDVKSLFDLVDEGAAVRIYR